MAFTTTMTLASDVDDSLISLWDSGVILGYTPELVCDQVATIRREIGAKIIYFTKYANISAATSALTEDADATSSAITDTGYSLTPAEHGAVVTRTKLSSLQTGGKVDTAAALLVGRNMGQTQDKLAMTALEAFSTTVIYPDPATSAATLTTSTVLDRKFANRLYNKLARNNTPGIGGQYIGIAHDDCLHDLREALTPVSQYQNLAGVLANEVGFAAGIRWLRSGNVTVTADSSGTIDSYKVNVLGDNAFGKAVSMEPHPVITGPFDKLGRFINVGWWGAFKYGVIDTANMVQGIVASSVGAN